MNDQHNDHSDVPFGDPGRASESSQQVRWAPDQMTEFGVSEAVSDPADAAAGPVHEAGVEPGWAPGVEPGWAPGVEPGWAPGWAPGAAPGWAPGVAPGWSPGPAPIPAPAAANPGQQWSGWNPQPAYQASGPAAPAPDRGFGRRRIVPLVLITALFSATLSGVGTYVAFTLSPRTTAVVQTTATTAQPNAQVVSLTQSEAIVRLVNIARPSVVTIDTTGTTSTGRRSAQFSGSGSGFIVSADGLILTNNHVVMDTSSLTVTLGDGSQLPATVVSTDAAHDLALIKVKATGLTPLTLGNSATLQVGQMAVAIGSPLGTFTDSVTQGIVSGLDRSISVGDSTSAFTENLTGLIQTDAAINPGNSGGPLLDVNGSVIGIVTAASSSAQDIGFAIPINQAKEMIGAAAGTKA